MAELRQNCLNRGDRRSNSSILFAPLMAGEGHRCVLAAHATWQVTSGAAKGNSCLASAAATGAPNGPRADLFHREPFHVTWKEKRVLASCTQFLPTSDCLSSRLARGLLRSSWTAEGRRPWRPGRLGQTEIEKNILVRNPHAADTVEGIARWRSSTNRL